MDKTTVTRTFSIGAVCGGTKASDDFFTAQRHSSARMRALLWATSSAVPFRCSLVSDSQTSRENIFPNILTPDSIPQFTIPSLSVESSLRLLDKETKEEEGKTSSGTEKQSSDSPAYSILSSSTSSSASALVPSARRAERSVSDPLTQRRPHHLKEGSYQAQHCLDPASRAALSLPHLTKVTTPYGFVTLSQSPQMANEEALLCQTGLRRLYKGEEAACCLGKSPGTTTCHIKGNSSHLLKAKDSTDSETKGRLEIKASTVSSTNDTVSPSSAPRHTDGKFKRHFSELIRKHFNFRH